MIAQMQRLIMSVRRAFGHPVPLPPSLMVRENSGPIKIVKRLTRGNVMLQQGRYITARDIEERRKRLLKDSRPT